MTLRYGDVVDSEDLLADVLPRPRGERSEFLLNELKQAPHTMRSLPPLGDDPVTGEDTALALYCIYELSFRGFADVSDGWEWEPSLIANRRILEKEFEEALRERTPDAGQPTPHLALAQLTEMSQGLGGPSLSNYLGVKGSLEQFREFAIHRSAYQLKEADAHTWAIPRLGGRAKAALIEIQSDEYGFGRARDMHQNLFAVTMSQLGLDPSYGAYIDRIPGTTLATSNLVTMLAQHRRLRGAAIGHLALFELCSVLPMSRYVAGLLRLGQSTDAQHFFAAHVIADAHHGRLALEQMVTYLLIDEPHLASDVVFGAAALTYVEATFAASLLDDWACGKSSLLPAHVELMTSPACGSQSTTSTNAAALMHASLGA